MTGYESKRAMARDKLIELAQEGMDMHLPDAPEYIVCKALIEALAQPAQEPAIGDIRALKHHIHELEGEIIGYKRILDAQPAQERNFCPRCGKRTKDIHTCTPPQENK